PAAALVGPGLAGLGRRLAAILPLVQAALDHAHHEDEQREEGDQEEAGVGDDLVVGLTPEALAAVVTLGQRDRRGQGEQRDGEQGGVEASAHRRGGYLSSTRMAVLIASDLAKDMAGVPLLRGVSFRLERRDRLT